MWFWRCSAVEKLKDSRPISGLKAIHSCRERLRRWELLGRILLQIKLQPISSNLKARLGHRNLAADFIGITPHLDFDFSLESYILALPCQCRIGWISSYGAQSNLLCWPCKNVKPLFDTSFLKSWWLVIPLSKLKWKRLSDNTPMCQIVLVYMVRIVLLDWYSDSYTTTYQ